MRNLRLAVAAVLALAAMPAFAQSAGSFTVGIGVHEVAPKSGNGTLTATPLGNLSMDVGTNVRPTVTGEYFVRDNLGIEVIATGTELYGTAPVDDPLQALGPIGDGDAVLVKASRVAGLERIAEALLVETGVSDPGL